MIPIILEWIAQTVVILGYAGIFFLMTLESIILPLPSEIILPFAGYLAGTGVLSFWIVVIVATLGSLAGSIVSYAIGRYGGRHFITVYGRYFFLDTKHLEKTEAWFERYGSRVVFFGRLLPIVRYFVSFAAGMAQMELRAFALYTVAGSFLWNLLFTWIGFALGQTWERIADYTAMIEATLVVLLLIVLMASVIRAIRKHHVAMLAHAKRMQAQVEAQLQRVTKRR